MLQTFVTRDGFRSLRGQASVGLLAILAAATATPSELSGEEALADVALARNALESIHPGYDRYTRKQTLDSIWDSIERDALRGMDRDELYLQLSLLLAQIRCDHTKAELPKDMEEARNSARVYLPFRFRLFDGRMYVDTSAVPDLVRGDEILRIDTAHVGQWLSLIEPLVPVDGDTDHVKPSIIEYGTEFMGGALDHFGPFLAPDLEMPARVLLEVRSPEGLIRNVKTKRINYEAYQALTGEQRFSRNFDTAVSFETIGDDGAYLAVDTFVNYRRPVDAVEFLKPYFQRLEREGRSKLIVDVRRNGGGSNDAQDALLRYLIAKPVLQSEGVLTRITSVDPEIRPHIDTWDPAALDPDPAWFEPAGDGYYRFVAGPPPAAVEPLPHAFDGDVVILTSPINASGVTHMLAALRNHGGFTFVGEKTGGAPTGATANVIYFLTLPESGIRIRVPVQRTLIAGRENLPQRDGLAPDVPVAETAEDYFNGVDRTLEAAKASLGL